MNKLNDFLNQISSSTKGGPLADKLCGSIEIGTIGPFPLSRMTDLRDAGVKAPFDSGEIRIELSNVSAAPLKIVSTRCMDEKEGSGTVTVVLGPMALSGQYRLFAIEQPKVDLDTGGNLMPLAALSEEDDPHTITEKEFDQLQQARLQRSILKRTKNGQQLLSTYNKHNDAYNDVFQNNGALQKQWPANGATSEMADYTSNALKTNSIINPTDRTFGEDKVKYNYNAFQQSTYVFAACLKDHGDAATAVTKFVHNVNQTGNKQNNTKSMTKSSVYEAVNKTSSSEFETSLCSGAGELHNAMALVAKNVHTDKDLETLKGHGYELSDQTIRAMQAIYAESARQAQPENQSGLWHGGISAALPESRFEFSFKDHGNGVVSTTLEQHDLPVPELRVDDSKWTGAAGKIARKRLSSAHFIHSLLVARITSYVEQNVSECVSKYMADNA